MSDDEIKTLHDRVDQLSDMVSVRLDSQDAETQTFKHELISIRGSLKKIEGYVDNAIKQDQEEEIIRAHEERLLIAAKKLKEDKDRQEREAWAKWEKWYPTLMVIGVLLGGLVGIPVLLSSLYWVFEFVINAFNHAVGNIPAPIH